MIAPTPDQPAARRFLASLRGRHAAIRAASFVALRLSQYAVLFVCGLISARLLGPEGRAQYALPLALGSSVWLVSHLSLDVAANRLYARQEAGLRELVRLRTTSVILIGLPAGAAALGLGLVFPGRFIGHASTVAVLLGAVTVPLWLAVSAAGGILLLIGRTNEYATAAATAAIIQLVVLLAIVVATVLTPALALLTVVVGLAVNALAFGVLVRRALGQGALIPSSDWALLKRLLRLGAVLHPATMALAFSLQIDLFCIAALGSTAEVGYYSIAAMLASSVFLAVNALAQAVVHRQLQPDEVEAAAYTVRFARKSVLLTLALAGLGIALGYPLIRVIYGAEWTSSVLPFMVLTVAAVPLMLQAPTTAFLARSARPLIFGLVGVATVLVNLALNVALIPVIGIVGSALASFITYSCYASGLLLLFRRITGWPLRAFFRPV